MISQLNILKQQERESILASARQRKPQGQRNQDQTYDFYDCDSDFLDGFNTRDVSQDISTLSINLHDQSRFAPDSNPKPMRSSNPALSKTQLAFLGKDGYKKANKQHKHKHNLRFSEYVDIFKTTKHLKFYVVIFIL